MIAAIREKARAEGYAAGQRDALAVPMVWSEAERDDLADTYASAAIKHGHYESLFAVVACFLRRRAEKIGAMPITEPKGSVE